MVSTKTIKDNEVKKLSKSINDHNTRSSKKFVSAEN